MRVQNLDVDTVQQYTSDFITSDPTQVDGIDLYQPLPEYSSENDLWAGLTL